MRTAKPAKAAVAVKPSKLKTPKAGKPAHAGKAAASTAIGSVRQPLSAATSWPAGRARLRVVPIGARAGIEVPARKGGSPQASVNEGKYAAIFDQASDAIITVLADGSIDAANVALEELTGYLKSEIVGAAVTVLAPAVEHQTDDIPLRPLTLELLAQPGMYEDVAIARKDGYVRFVDVSVRSVDGPRGPLALALFRDLTEKRRMDRELITKHGELRAAYLELERKNIENTAMQQTLVQSGKMAALGELTAGIAHEINQPLQGIRGYAQEMQELIMQPPPLVAAGLREIISCVDKMAAITQHLRGFVRKSDEGHEDIDVHLVIEEALKMLGRQLASRGIAIERQFAPELPRVYANSLQLEQVFINLVSNARDAIETTGRGRGCIRIATRTAEGFVEIAFRDDGCGMSGQTRTKAFNPFFTTKEVGKGMGLGLSLSYGILSKIHASIVVESELGKGAEFLIRVPRDYRQST